MRLPLSGGVCTREVEEPCDGHDTDGYDLDDGVDDQTANLGLH